MIALWSSGLSDSEANKVRIRLCKPSMTQTGIACRPSGPKSFPWMKSKTYTTHHLWSELLKEISAPHWIACTSLAKGMCRDGGSGTFLEFEHTPASDRYDSFTSLTVPAADPLAHRSNTARHRGNRASSTRHSSPINH